MIALIVIIGLSLLIIGHEAGHFFAAKFFGMRIDEFGFGFPPKLWSRKKGETEYSLNALPFGGFVRIAGENDRLEGNLGQIEALPAEERKRFFYFAPAWQRSIVILAGVFVNFLIAWLLISGILMAGTAPSLMIGEVRPNSPAAAAGLQPGDVVQGFATAEAFTKYVRENGGKEVVVSISRSGETLQFTVIPRENPDPEEGAVGVGFQGIAPRSTFVALGHGFLQTLELAKLTLFAFGAMLRDLVTTGSLPQDVVGLVGIFPVAQQIGQAGFAHLLQLIALISINLAVINLLPFPALDGGRFIFILIEKAKGSPLPQKSEAWVNAAGFVFLIFLMVLIAIRDVVRLY